MKANRTITRETAMTILYQIFLFKKVNKECEFMKKKTKQGKSFGIISIVLSVLYMLISRIVLLNIIFAILLILSFNL